MGEKRAADNINAAVSKRQTHRIARHRSSSIAWQMTPAAVEQSDLQRDSPFCECSLRRYRNIPVSGADLEQRQFLAAALFRHLAQQRNGSLRPAKPLVNVAKVLERAADLCRRAEVVVQKLRSHTPLH